jgi:1-aminocyclopropane-1-carboxylate deaminase/D-cysteine desulfhydrase-like pyridoxal-dependent ACC family enzyme
MLAIAQVAHVKQVPFTYFSRRLDLKHAATRSQDADNLRVAERLGMRHIEVPAHEYHQLAESKDLAKIARTYVDHAAPLYIPQGAAFKYAEDGIQVLADELNAYCLHSARGEGFSVVVPCGTGATAFYLAQHLDPSIRLFSVPCVGDSAYLSQQFDALAAQHATRADWKMPVIFSPLQKARFGRLSWPLYDLYHELRDVTGIEFDLLYAAFTWQTLFEPANLARALGSNAQRQLLYLHTGGVSGNGSMLARYHQKLS